MVSEIFSNHYLKDQNYQKYTHKVMSGSGANLGPIGHHDLMFQLVTNFLQLGL